MASTSDFPSKRKQVLEYKVLSHLMVEVAV